MLLQAFAPLLVILAAAIVLFVGLWLASIFPAHPVLFVRNCLVKDKDWWLETEPSLFYSGDWADPKLWGQRHGPYRNFARAYWAALRYLDWHPYGKADFICTRHED